MPDYKIIHSDCLDAMREMEDNSIDFIVTDPPYGLSFMNKGWDYAIPNAEYWKECARILKPGSFLASMGGTRTFHRLTCAIEDGGFQIRDCISWIYGSGFPKSHNNFGFKGYGTVLKPAWEPIIIAMKPLDGTFANNAEKWGVAGINIDSSRIEAKDQDELAKNWNRETVTDMRSGNYGNGIASGIKLETKASNGRWPANLILDEESAEQLDQMTENNVSRFFYCAKSSSSERNKGLEGMPLNENSFGIDALSGMNYNSTAKNGVQQRLPKANNHPTVKPISLMKYIITLLAPPGSPILLDPFCGSGSTICAAKELGISAIGIEKEKEYVEIATKRLDAAQCKPQMQMEMFE